MAENTEEPEKAVDSPHPVTSPFQAIEVTDIDRIWSRMKATPTQISCMCDWSAETRARHTDRLYKPRVPLDMVSAEIVVCTEGRGRRCQFTSTRHRIKNAQVCTNNDPDKNQVKIHPMN